MLGWEPDRTCTERYPPAADPQRLASYGPVSATDAPTRGRIGTKPEQNGTNPRQDGTRPGQDVAIPAVGGGWIGAAGFDASASWWGYFGWVLLRDRTGRWRLEAAQPIDLEAIAVRIECAVGHLRPPEALTITDLAGTTREDHVAAVEHAISAIRAGELFQVNVCARMDGVLHGSTIDLFDAGLRRLHPDYAGYLRTPDRTVVSFSPELFLRRTGRDVLTAPIKGTRPRRTSDDGRDDLAAEELRASGKDRAENVMIVDLMRNDLSRVCEPGSVTTPELLAVRPAPGVWHLVSEVSGRLRPEATDHDLLDATFPPGSVTGAPKIRALTMIEQLEDRRRGLFTGAIGYLAVTDRTELNVAIRTYEFAADQGRFQLGVGGGITADSIPMAEWHETLIKAAPLLDLGDAGRARSTWSTPVGPTRRNDSSQRSRDGSSWPSGVAVERGILETMLVLDDRILALSDHLTRLDSSCREVYRWSLPDDLPVRLTQAVATRRGRHVLRVIVGPREQAIDVELRRCGRVPTSVSLRVVPGRRGCWRHKWADRSWLSAQETPGTLPLFVSEFAGHVLETSRANIAIVPEPGTIATPPLTDDILAGVTRRRVLDAAGDRGWRTEIRPIELGELARARLVLSLSSISGIVAVDRLGDRLLPVDQALLKAVGGWLDEAD